MNTNKDYGVWLGVLLVLTAIGTGIYFNTEHNFDQYDFPGSSYLNKDKTTGTKQAPKLDPAKGSTPATGWKTETNAQYEYTISWPDASVLNAYKITHKITVLDNTKTVACTTNEDASTVQAVTDTGIELFHTSLVPDGTDHVSTFTTVKDGLCYEIVFRFADINPAPNAPEAKPQFDLVNRIISSFSFK